MASLSRLLTCLLLVLALCLAAAPASAQTFTTLYSFAAGTSDGGYPQGGVSIDSSGKLYGTTTSYGSHGTGVVYKLVPPTGGGSWTESVVYNLGGTNDGKYPYSGVLIGSNGDLFGTTINGGQLGLNYGTFYEVSPTSGTEIGEFSFSGGGSGQNEYTLGNVIQDSSGNFYGTSYLGGAHNQGAVWKLSFSSPFVVETVIYSFNRTATNLDGITPYAGLVMDSSGNLYGTTYKGGTGAGCQSAGCGTVFKLSPSGGTTWNETILYSFDATLGDGVFPESNLIIDNSGNLIGTTTVGSATGNGEVFQISPSGTKTVIHSFTGGTTDGSQPWSGVTMDASGNLWGTTRNGGAHNYGTVYKLTNTFGVWTESVIHSFSYFGDGAFPLSNLTLDSSGNLYGTNNQGGSGGRTVGTVFKIVP